MAGEKKKEVKKTTSNTGLKVWSTLPIINGSDTTYTVGNSPLFRSEYHTVVATPNGRSEIAPDGTVYEVNPAWHNAIMNTWGVPVAPVNTINYLKLFKK